MTTTTSNTTPTGKSPNLLSLPDIPAPSVLFQEHNTSAPAPVATIVAPLTPLNIMVILNKMSTNYYSSVDHPHPFYSPSPIPQTEQIPTSPRYAPSPIPFVQSPLPMSKKSLSPEIIAIQHNHAVQTDPLPFPHPITLAKLVKEHFPQPRQFLNVFYSTLDSLYLSPPNRPKRATPNMFKESPIEHSTPALPQPKAAFSENKNPSLKETILLQQLLNDWELEIPILVYCQAGSPLFTLYVLSITGKLKTQKHQGF